MSHLRLLPIILLLLTSCAQRQTAKTIEIPFFTESNMPKYEDITFWDPYIQDYRGIRAIFYTVLTDRENRLVDKRLHDTFANLLAHMCQSVITIESFKEPTQQKMVENILVNLVDQWKLRGKIEPQSLFQPLPFLDADVIVFMERNAYDQIWKEEDKKLLIGLNVAAFEMDLGEPLYANRFVTEVPWSGEDTSYTKAERQALLKVVNNIGETFAQSAKIINRAHEMEMKEQAKEEAQQKNQLRQELQAENQQYANLIRQAKNIVKDTDSNLPLAITTQQEIENLESLLKVPVLELTPEMIQERQDLAYNIQTHAQQLLELMQAEEPKEFAIEPEPVVPPEPEPERYPTGFKPMDAENLDTEAVEGQRPIPSLTSPSGDIRNRSWLVPENKDALESQVGRDPQFGDPSPVLQPDISGQEIDDSTSADSVIPSAQEFMN